VDDGCKLDDGAFDGTNGKVDVGDVVEFIVLAYLINTCLKRPSQRIRFF